MHKYNKHNWSVLTLLYLDFFYVSVDPGGSQICKSFAHDFFLL